MFSLTENFSVDILPISAHLRCERADIFYSCKSFSMFHNVPSRVFYNFHFSGNNSSQRRRRPRRRKHRRARARAHAWHRRCIVYILARHKKGYLNCWYDWMRWELAMNIPTHITSFFSLHTLTLAPWLFLFISPRCGNNGWEKAWATKVTQWQ